MQPAIAVMPMNHQSSDWAGGGTDGDGAGGSGSGAGGSGSGAGGGGDDDVTSNVPARPLTSTV